MKRIYYFFASRNRLIFRQRTGSSHTFREFHGKSFAMIPLLRKFRGMYLSKYCIFKILNLLTTNNLVLVSPSIYSYLGLDLRKCRWLTPHHRSIIQIFRKCLDLNEYIFVFCFMYFHLPNNIHQYLLPYMLRLGFTFRTLRYMFMFHGLKVDSKWIIDFEKKRKKIRIYVKLYSRSIFF